MSTESDRKAADKLQEIEEKAEKVYQALARKYDCDEDDQGDVWAALDGSMVDVIEEILTIAETIR